MKDRSNSQRQPIYITQPVQIRTPRDKKAYGIGIIGKIPHLSAATPMAIHIVERIIGFPACQR